jgi:regulatory protein
MANGGKEKQAARPRGRRAPREVTPDHLERAALHHLERFASSAANLRRVLERRVLRAARHHGTDPAEAAPWIDALIARFRASGLLDDATYAQGRAAALFRRGDSQRSIRAKLAAKGVGAEDIDGALAALRAEVAADGAAGDDGRGRSFDLQAAANYLRRRRIGPHRPPEARAANRARDLAALARAGFSYDVARAALDGDGDEVGGPER